MSATWWWASAGFAAGMVLAALVVAWLFHDYEGERAPSQGWGQ